MSPQSMSMSSSIRANISLFVFQRLLTGSSDAGVPTWVFVCFWLGAVCCLVTISLAMMRTKEVTPTDEELADVVEWRWFTAGELRIEHTAGHELEPANLADLLEERT